MSTFYNAKFFNSLPIDKFLDLFKLKEIKDDKTKKKCDRKIAIYFGKDIKTLWEKEKMLVTSIFFFSYNVFKRLLFQGA